MAASQRSIDSPHGSLPLTPTYSGFIGTTLDAILLFEACLSGQRAHISRRPYDRERVDLIKSGCVFVYEEHSSGIKRWTDGISWSPSRLLGNFLIYRQLDTALARGENKKVTKKSKEAIPEATQRQGDRTQVNPNHLLYGSLIDSYDFKDNGLVKKTISVNLRGVTHHLISYYTAGDVINNSLQQPDRDPSFINTFPRAELLISQNFRCPIETRQLNVQQRLFPGAPFWYPSNPQPHGNNNTCVSFSTPGTEDVATSSATNNSQHQRPCEYASHELAVQRFH